MVAERPFHNERLGGIDIALEHEIRLRGHFQIARYRLCERHRLAAQESRKDELVDRWWKRRARRIHRWRISAEGNADRHPLAALRHLTPMRGANFVTLPVHRERALSRLHDAIHTDIADPALRIARDHHRESDVGPAILRPALHEGNATDVDFLVAPYNLLAVWRARS